MASVAARWRRYTRLSNQWHLRYSHPDYDHLGRWGIDPDLDGRIAEAFAALPLWLRVAEILCTNRGRCWPDAVYEVRHYRKEKT